MLLQMNMLYNDECGVIVIGVLERRGPFGDLGANGKMVLK
jgi:hypothetical protein